MSGKINIEYPFNVDRVDWETVRLEWNVMALQCDLDNEPGFHPNDQIGGEHAPHHELNQLVQQGKTAAVELLKRYTRQFGTIITDKGRSPGVYLSHYFEFDGKRHINTAIVDIINNANDRTFVLKNLAGCGPLLRQNIFDHIVNLGQMEFFADNKLDEAGRRAVIDEIVKVFNQNNIMITFEDLSLPEPKHLKRNKNPDGSWNMGYSYTLSFNLKACALRVS